MNLNLKLNNILFLDIETVPQEENWNKLSNELKSFSLMSDL